MMDGCRGPDHNLTLPTASQASVPVGDSTFAPRVRFGRYIFAGEIGAGGMGVVYAAHDPELDRMVAVKLLHGGGDRRLEERLRREAQAMAQLAHPNVITVHDVGVFEDRMFIAMEYVEGETLARWCATTRPLREILDVYCAAGRGLAAAHAAGIVHRDFKPENVLIGNDGRVRVGDFGLARPVGSADLLRSASSVATAPALPRSFRACIPAAALTAQGALVGTPCYMGPELYAGVEADARSDQFSFSVALFTALYGERPFAGDTLDALRANVRAGRVREPARGRRVPRRIRAALHRGLALDPAARFASIDELLRALAPPRHRARRWLTALGAALAVAAIGAWHGAYSSATVPDERCTGAPAAFAAAWNAESRRKIEAAFTASTTPYAAAAFARVNGALDQYAMRWTRAHTEACRATRILGEQTEATLDLRMGCLERRRQEVAALVATLSAADGRAIGRSAAAAESLGDIATCADVAALRQVIAPPNDAGARAKLAEMTPRLASARAKYELGAWTAAREVVRQVAADAHALGYAPFEAEARFLQSDIEIALDDTARGEASLEAAVWLAEAGRHDEIAARSWVRLIFLVGFRKAEYARALAFMPRATAALARLGGNADVESRLERALGLIETSKSHIDAGIAHYQKAVELRERAFGNEDHYLAIILEGLGIALLNQGHAGHAVQIQQRAHAILDHLLGPNHPDTAHALTLLANARSAAGQPALAERQIRQALAVQEITLGTMHDDIAASLGYLATALDDQDRTEEAVEIQRRAIAVGEQVLGTEHPLAGERRVILATLLARLGRYPQAVDQLRRAEAIFTKTLGPDHAELMFVHVAYGNILVRQRRWRDAVASYQRGMPILDSAQITRRDLTQAVINLELAYLALHQPAHGIALLERLAQHLDDVHPDLRVAVEFTLTRALWDTGDRKRACELATRALAKARSDRRKDHDTEQLERWLVYHRA